MPRARSLVAAAAVSALTALPLAAAVSAPASAATPGYDGYSSGTAVHLSVLNSKAFGLQLAGASVALSGATVSSTGNLKTTDALDQRLVDPANAKKNADGRASALGVSIGQAATLPPQIEPSIAEAAAPPSATDTSSAGEIPLDPVLHANILPSTAAANYNADGTCVVDKPLSQSKSQVAGLTVLDLGSAAIPIPGLPAVAVAKIDGAVTSESKTSLAAPVKGAKGNSLVSETIEQVAPITLFAGTGQDVTIKLLAPLRLQVRAGGVAGGATASYAPVGSTSPTDPVLSITAGGSTQTITLQQLLGNQGLTIHLGLVDVTVGTPPTVKASADGTSVTATANLVTLKVPGEILTNQTPVTLGGPLAPVGDALNQILTPVLQGLKPVLTQVQDALNQAGLGAGAIASLDVAHFEAAAAVPAGGIVCPPSTVPVTKTPDKASVAPGGSFTDTITIKNPFGCTLTGVKVVDTITADNGVKYTVTEPAGATSPVTITGIPDIPTGKSATVKVTVKVGADSGGGKISDEAAVTGSCTGSTGASIDVAGTAGAVTTVNAPVKAGAQLPRTGSSPLLPLAATGLAGIGLATWRLRRTAR